MDVDDDAGVAESKWARIEQWRRSAPVNDDDDECGDSPQAEEKGEVNAAPKRCKVRFLLGFLATGGTWEGC